MNKQVDMQAFAVVVGRFMILVGCLMFLFGLIMNTVNTHTSQCDWADANGVPVVEV